MKRTTRKMVVVFAIPSLHMGGIERHLLKQLACFDRERYNFHLITFFHNTGSADLYDKVPAQVQVHRFVFRPGIDLAHTWQVVRLLRTIRPDLVVSSMVFPNTLMRLLKPFVGYRSIAREHNTYADKTFRHKLRDHVCSYFSDAIVAVSNTVAEYASRQAWVPRSKFTVIHNGVDIDAIQAYQTAHPEAREEVYEEFGLSPHTKILLNVARLKPQKNHSLLLEAFALFVRTHPDHALFILGKGADEQKVRDKVRALGLEDNVFLPGFRDDVYSFYMASSCFILTSDIEGFPNVAVEAMAFGVPVLSTDVAGIDEFLVNGKNGFLLTRDATQVCDTIGKIVELSGEEKRKMADSCRVTAAQYSMQTNVRQYEALFTKIVEQHDA